MYLAMPAKLKTFWVVIFEIGTIWGFSGEILLSTAKDFSYFS